MSPDDPRRAPVRTNPAIIRAVLQDAERSNIAAAAKRAGFGRETVRQWTLTAKRLEDWPNDTDAQDWRRWEEATAYHRAAQSRYVKRRYLSRSNRTTISEIGTRRRLRALHALGWSWHALSAEMGGTNRTLAWRIAHGHASTSGRVYADTALKVREVYKRLSMQPAPGGIGATKARNAARRKGWAPPLAWTDIDDPDEQPDLGEIKHDSRGRPVVRDALIEDAEWLADDDLHLDVVVERLGVTRANFHAACRRAGRLDLYHRLARRLPYGAGADSMAQHARRTA